MDSNTIQILIAMIIYMGIVIGIGIAFMKRANKNSESYFLGGRTLGPLVLFSLFWKRMNRAGAIAGMIGGGLMVFFWKLVIRPLGGAWNIYELLPAFIFSSILIIVVSLLTKEPSDEIKKDFDEVKAGIGIDM